MACINVGPDLIFLCHTNKNTCEKIFSLRGQIIVLLGGHGGTDFRYFDTASRSPKIDDRGFQSKNLFSKMFLKLNFKLF